jgi:serine protease inhibitor
MRTYLSFIAIAAVLFAACEEKDESPKFPTEEKIITLSPDSKAMVSTDNKFGIDIFKRMVAVDQNDNMMISPISISQALLMTYNGANGTTKTAFEETLFLSGLTKEHINQAKKELVEALLNADPGVTMSIANSIWYRNGVSVKPEFVQINRDYYDAEVNEVVFDQTAVNLINNWVSDNTNGKIDQIIEQIDPDAIMFLINAIYFNGNWKYTFNKTNTSNDDFKLKDQNIVSVPFMNQEVTAKMMFHNDFSLIELPYGRGNFNMLIFLPGENKTIDDVLDDFTDENYNEWINGLTEMNVELSIPKFKFKYEKVLNDYLGAMGLYVAFNPNEADFTNITESIDLYINFVKHKSFIEVNEKGTEAAAVTIVGIYTTSEPSFTKFIADRPFLFVIREKYTNAILFMGKVENPLQE